MLQAGVGQCLLELLGSVENRPTPIVTDAPASRARYPRGVGVEELTASLPEGFGISVGKCLHRVGHRNPRAQFVLYVAWRTRDIAQSADQRCSGAIIS